MFSNIFKAKKLYIFGIFICLILIIINFLCFETKKLDNKKLTLICTFISIGAISRCALYFIPCIKPLTSIIILSSIFFGAAESFFIGSMSMLISNIFLGQGPWTFWQMAAAGLVGAFSGLIFNRLKFKVSNINLIVVTIICILLIYSPIMNLSSFIFMFPEFNMSILITYLITCLVSDISHITVTIIILLPVYNTAKKYI
ncbi:MAG: ECF transporter S component [Oscillospiraceae bacterium]|nr:ECF transporter S component [Oscillospiraceae bacterium]